jgi:cytochrome P450 family 3 subfamily A
MELSWLLCLIALLLVLLLFYYSYVFEPYQVFKRLGIPGPPPKVLYGNYKQLAQFEGGVGGLKSQEYRETQYGSVCGYYIGYDPYLMITEPEMIREFLVQRFNNFTNRPPILVQFLKTPTLVNARDAKVWRKLRQIISPTFTIRKLRMMESLMSRPIDRFLSKVEKAESTLSSIDIHTSMFELATEILLAAFFGKAADIQGDELGKRLVNCISVPFTASKDGGSVDVFKGIAFISAFPFLRHLANIGIKKSSVGKAISELYVVSGEIVEERKRSTLSHNDFLQQIMGSDLKSDDVRTQVVSMILGGNETVTSALTSAAYLLAIHPDVQDKLIQEISEYFKGNPVSLHDIFL